MGKEPELSDREWTMVVMMVIVCFTAGVMQQCHYNHEEGMLCMSKGGSWFNERCHMEPEDKK